MKAVSFDQLRGLVVTISAEVNECKRLLLQQCEPQQSSEELLAIEQELSLARMAKNKEPMSYERANGKNIVKITGSAQFVAPLAWLDRVASIILPFVFCGIGVAMQWTPILVVLKWVKHKIL